MMELPLGFGMALAQNPRAMARIFLGKRKKSRKKF